MLLPDVPCWCTHPILPVIATDAGPSGVVGLQGARGLARLLAFVRSERKATAAGPVSRVGATCFRASEVPPPSLPPSFLPLFLHPSLSLLPLLSCFYVYVLFMYFVTTN